MKSLRRLGKETAVAEPDKTEVEELQMSKGIHRIWRERVPEDLSMCPVERIQNAKSKN